MSFVDNDPPKDADIGSLRHPERLSIFSKTISRINTRKKRCVFFTIEEIRVLILKEGVAPFSLGKLSRKDYKRALAMQERAQKYLEEEKQQKSEDDLSL